jgi:hypothetical protein
MSSKVIVPITDRSCGAHQGPKIWVAGSKVSNGRYQKMCVDTSWTGKWAVKGKRKNSRQWLTTIGLRCYCGLFVNGQGDLAWGLGDLA